MFSLTFYFLILIQDPSGGRPTGATLGVYNTAATCLVAAHTDANEGYLTQCREVVIHTTVEAIEDSVVIGPSVTP
jgi:hypothetical protein